jgi:hypothetical protein
MISPFFPYNTLLQYLYMRFKYLGWVIGVFIIVLLLWLSLFLLLTTESKNWSNLKKFTTIVIQDPKTLLGAYFYKTKNSQNPSSKTNSELVPIDSQYLFNFLDLSDKWDWNKSYVVAKVLGINTEDRILSAEIILPATKSFSGIPKNISILCPSDKTRIALKDNLVVTNEIVDLFSSVSKNDLVYSYCSDDKCNTFIKSCALIKMNSE